MKVSIPSSEMLAESILGYIDESLPEELYTRARPLLEELARDWLREANKSDRPDRVLDILCEDFDEILGDAEGEELLSLLLAQVLERRSRSLSVRSFALGKAVLQAKVHEAEAQSQGKSLLEESDVLTREIVALGDGNPLKAQLERRLQDVRLEALYAIERKAMSLRLGRYQVEFQG